MEQWWKDYPWRLIQTNLREIDMLDMDAEEYVRQLKSFEATIVMINTAGIIASYPTNLKHHFQSPYLKGDSLEKVMRLCRENGIRVIARTDFSKIRRPIYEQNPDWAYRTAAGDIVDYNGDVHACVNGGYQQDYALKILREVCETLPVDGLYINMGGFQVRDYSYRQYGICHCDNCKQKFREQYGRGLPSSTGMDNPDYRAYRAFQRQVIAEYTQRLEEMVHGINPGIMIDGVDFHRMESNTEYGRPLPSWHLSASSNTRCMRGVDGAIQPSNTSVDFIGFYYRHVAVSPELQQLRLWQNLANLGGLDYYLIGRLDNKPDRSGFGPIQEVFRFARRNEQSYLGMRSVAEALVLRTQKWARSPEEFGWIRALTESHILFDEAEVEDALRGDLSKYKAIVLGGIEVVPGALAKKLDDYVKNGGCLICSGDGLKYNENFEPYDEMPLTCAGVRRRVIRRDDMASAMFRINEAERALFPSLGDTDVVFFGDSYWYHEYDGNAEQCMQMIAPQMFGPPERCYHTTVTAQPGVVIHRHGAGKCVTLPWKAGELYFREGYSNTYLLLYDVLRTITGLTSVSEGLTGMVEVTYGVSTSGSHGLVQLVNGTGHFATSCLKPVPVRGIAVTVPCTRPILRAVSLVSGKECPFSQEQGHATVQVEELAAFESIRLDFASPSGGS